MKRNGVKRIGVIGATGYTGRPAQRADLPPYVVTEDQIGRALALIRKGLQHIPTIPTIPNRVEA